VSSTGAEIVTFDPETYRAQVLDPARRAGGVPPPDLLVRYAVPEAIRGDAAAFGAHVETVRRYWLALKHRRVYEKLAVALLAAHADLAARGELTATAFAKARDVVRTRARQELRAYAASLAATTSVVPRSALTSLTTAVGGGLDEPAVERELAGHGIAVLERPWVLPAPADGPGLSTLPALSGALRVLGHVLVADAVFGPERVRAGFRLRDGFVLLTGERLTRAALDELRERQARRALDERKTALDNVLAALAGSAGAGEGLDTLVLHQFVDALRPQIDAGLPPRAVAGAATALGLVADEAAEIALALTRRPPGDAAGSPSALRPPSLDPETAARVEALLAEADDARDRGATEVEAGHLAEAVEITRRDDLRRRLWALPAPAPADVSATVRDEQVHVEWRSGPARTGGLRYRVVRRIGSAARTPEAGTTVGETTGRHLVDEGPPAGEPLHYSVFAARGGPVWSFGTAAPDFCVVLPEVGDVRLTAHGDAITGSWRAPAGVSEVVVTADPDPDSPAPDADDARIATTAAGFRHHPVLLGARYRYRVRAAYLDVEGHRRLSPGVVVWGTCEPSLRPVTDLRVEPVQLRSGTGDGPPRLALSWSAPGPNPAPVRIRTDPAPPPWRPGTVVGLDELSRYGVPLADGPGPAGTGRIVVDHRPGRYFFTPVTTGRDRGVIGTPVAVATTEPVSGLVATRHDDRVHLRWTWPDRGSLCRVTTSVTGAAVLECTRRRYQDDGGFEVPVGDAAVTLAVSAVHHDVQGEIVSPTVEVELPARPAPPAPDPPTRVRGAGAAYPRVAPAPRPTCPYCYTSFAEKEIRFRCSGRPAPGRAACPVTTDEHLENWLGYTRPLPPTFVADGRRGAADCPDCGGETTHRVCPHCHSRLPVHFGKVDSRLIAMVGARETGKTVFMTVLIHELMHRVGRVLEAALVGSDDETRRSFDRDYDRRLYQQHTLPAATAPVNVRTRLRPLVFRLTRRGRGRRLGRAPAEQHTLLSFFDAAGEDLTSTESTELNARYLTGADGVILLLDPLRLPGVRDQVAAARPGTTLPTEGDHPYDVLTRVTDLLRAANPDPAGRIRTPVAVVFTKLDAVEHLLAPGSPLTRRPGLRAEVDEADGLAVHDQVAHLLDEWDGPRTDQLMRHHFEHFRYFAVSALGRPPLDPPDVADVMPHRVHDPFLWLLAAFGTVGRGRAGKGRG
jgi:Double-GTPase 2